MLLVMDIGNTNIVIGLFKDDEFLYDWRIKTDVDMTSDEYGMFIRQILSYYDISLEDIDDIIISSVVPNLNNTMINMSLRYLGTRPIIVGPGTKTGMDIIYDNPREVGSDRIVNAVGAFEKYGGPLIVLDFGTAVTFDVINEEGAYLGGAIAPGIQISADALFTRTAKLPKIELKNPGKFIGKTTVQSMQSGIVYGYIALVEGIVEGIKKEIQKETKVVATGGFAKLISNETDMIDVVDKRLSINGLRKIYERQ